MRHLPTLILALAATAVVAGSGCRQSVQPAASAPQDGEQERGAAVDESDEPVALEGFDYSELFS